MNPRLLLLASVLAGIGTILLRQPNPSAADTGPSQALRVPQFLGAGSCSASACHNANFAKGHTGGEYTLWITRDPHANAYETLFSVRSALLQKNLRSPRPAHEDSRCLKCHVAPAYEVKQPPTDAPYFKTDGVSCESCHGPAKNWIASHHLDAWRFKSPAQKKQAGMNDTQSLVGRAQVCVTCHVGAPGMDVDHDLIAAGHPRLHFEFASFYAQMPRHWPDWKDRDATKSARGRADFEARAWLVGQLATAHAAMELLADRAGDRAKPWPEFAEYDCASCHQDLRASGLPKRKPGAVPWNSQIVFQLARPFKDFAELQNTMNASINPNRDTVAQHARAAARNLQLQLENLEPRPGEDPRWQSLLAGLLKMNEHRSKDEATQARLGVLALYNTQRDLRLRLPPDLEGALFNFARQADRPNSYDPKSLRRRLADLQTLGNEKGP